MINMSMQEAANAIDAKLLGDNVNFIGCSIDSRDLVKDNLFIALKGDKFDGHNFISTAENKGASALILEKEVTHNLPTLMVKDARRAMGALAKAWRRKVDIPLLAITGSNGKTTVKEMIFSILSEVGNVKATKGNMNNDIGVPLTLFDLNKEHDYAVIEMGASYKGEIKWLSSIAMPSICVITQCAPAHLEGFGSIEGVAKAKGEIFSGMDKNGVAIINADDPYANYWKNNCNNKYYTFGLTTKNVDVSATDIKLIPEQYATSFRLISKQGIVDIKIKLLGKHNVVNALAAISCCLILDIPLFIIKKGLEKMNPVEGRLQIKFGKFGCLIIDDTYNANPTSCAAALNVLSGYGGKKYFILGDMSELGDTAKQLHFDIGDMARKLGVDALFAIGELSKNSLESFGKEIKHFSSHDELSKHLSKIIKNDKATLLFKGSRKMRLEYIVKEMVEKL